MESLIAELMNSVPALRGDFLVSALLAIDPNGSFNWDIRKGVEHLYTVLRRAPVTKLGQSRPLAMHKSANCLVQPEGHSHADVVEERKVLAPQRLNIICQSFSGCGGNVLLLTGEQLR